MPDHACFSASPTKKKLLINAFLSIKLITTQKTVGSHCSNPCFCRVSILASACRSNEVLVLSLYMGFDRTKCCFRSVWAFSLAWLMGLVFCFYNRTSAPDEKPQSLWLLLVYLHVNLSCMECSVCSLQLTNYSD